MYTRVSAQQIGLIRTKSARLKVERANEHIFEANKRIFALPELDTVTVQVSSGHNFIKHDFALSDELDEIALLVGDAIHNLKCALDHTWLATLRRVVPTAINSKTLFPVYPSMKHLEDALRERKIDITSPVLFDTVITKIQPYDGGNDSIWAIHRLDIEDKHRLLVPCIGYSGINGIELKDDDGEVRKGNTWPTTEPPPWFIPVNDGWSITNKGKLALTVLFDEGTPVKHLDVGDMLQHFAVIVVSVIQLLEGVI